MTSRADRQAGFTLIEVLAVLAILAMAIGIIAARGPARSPALDARGAAGQVSRALRLARSQAVATNRPVAFTLDLARHGFQVGEGAWQAIPAELGLAMVAVAEANPDPARGRIVFNPEGGSSGGRVRISAGRSALTVGADWLSGRVTVALAQ